MISRIWAIIFIFGTFSMPSQLDADITDGSIAAIQTFDVEFTSALTAASKHINAGQLTLAQWWLRKAFEHAPNSTAQIDIRQLYDQVRRKNPLNLGLKFTLTPSNNVNNGSHNETIWVGGLPFKLDNRERAYSGYAAEASVSASYRLSENTSHQTDFLIDAFYRYVWLSDQNQSLDSLDVRGSDFNQGTLSFGTKTSLHTNKLFTPIEYQWNLGGTWFGDKALSFQGEVSVKKGYKLSEHTVIEGTGSFRKIARQDSSSNSSTRQMISLGALHKRQNNTYLSYNLLFENNRSASPAVASRALAFGANWQFPDLKNISPSFQFKIENREFVKWQSLASHRSDRSLLASLSLDLHSIERYGFSPRITVGYRSTDSNISIYDRNAGTIGISVVSNF